MRKVDPRLERSSSSPIQRVCVVLPVPHGGSRTWGTLGFGRLRSVIAPMGHGQCAVTVVLLGAADTEVLGKSLSNQLNMHVVVKNFSDVISGKLGIRGKRFLHDDQFFRLSYQLYQHLKAAQYDLAIFDDFGAPGFVSIRARKTGIALQRTPVLTLFHSCSELQRFRGALLPEDPVQQAKVDYAERYCVENSDKVLVDDWCVFEWAIGNGWAIPMENVWPLDAETTDLNAPALTAKALKALANPAISATGGVLDESPGVTVCIAHRNDTANLEVALESLRENDYATFQVIVVDDGSTDPRSLHEFDRLARKYQGPMWRFIKKGHNEGPGATRNLAASLAKDGLIIFMDSDNVATPVMVSSLVRGMTRSQADCLTCWFATFQGEGRVCQDADATLAPLGPCIELGIFENCFGDTNFCIKKAVFDDLGGFSTARGFGLEDWHFLARLALRGYRLDVLPEEIFFYRVRAKGWNAEAQSYANAGLARDAYLEFLPTSLKKLVRDVAVPLMIQQHARQHARVWQVVEGISSFLRSKPRMKNIAGRCFGLLTRAVKGLDNRRRVNFSRRLISLRRETTNATRMLKRLVNRVRAGAGGMLPHTGSDPISLGMICDSQESTAARELKDESVRLGISLGQEDGPGGSDYVYAPTDPENVLNEFDLKNILLCLNHIDYDFITVAADLAASADQVSVPAANHLVRRSVDSWLTDSGQQNPRTGPLIGRRLRLMPHRGQTTSLGPALSTRASALCSHEVIVDESFPSPRSGSPCRRNLHGVEFIPVYTSSKPVVFVWPTFLAVGGVERNTAVVVRELRSLVDFVVINFEPLSQKRGSLHHQFIDNVAGLYDLGELGSPDDWLPMLASLKRIYQPSLIWVCNGCTWLCDNAMKVRSLFPNVPIVDQQVYDTDEGWINRYHERGIQSFDRFIAINQKIEEVFTSRLGISHERIDLIYHALDSQRFRLKDLSPEERLEVQTAFGLPIDRPIFAFIGRLAPQKRPDAFVRLANWMRILGDDSFFVMIGDGQLAAEVEEAIKLFRLDNLKRIPFVEDMSRILPLLSGIVITSDYEGLPIAMTEGLSCGVPVLSTDVGDVKLLLDIHGSGLVVHVPQDSRDFADCFKNWKEHLPAYRAAARTSAEEVRQRFSSSNIATLYVESWNRASLAVRGRPFI
jgi:glycosyltransferase involved in cell wall biosynthesis